MTGARRLRTGLAVAASAVTLAAGSAVLAGPAAAAEPFLDPAAPCSEPAAPAPAPFADRDRVPAVHLPTLDCAFARGIVQGRVQGGMRVFDPQAPVRRDQMATFLVQTLLAGGYDVPAPSGQPFSDIEGNVHADRIRQLAQLGITVGSGTPGQYAPAQMVTRGQMATYLLRTANVAFEDDDLAEGATGSVTFPDVAAGDVHRPAIEAIAELFQLTTGFADGTYGPAVNTTRAQMATFVVRLLDLIEIPEP